MLRPDGCMPEQNIIARAMELARSGGFKNVSEIERQLTREGFSSVSMHLYGQTLRRQLMALMRSAAVNGGPA